MALDKNDGIFLPSIDGVVSGKTSQVDGMNGIMNNLIGNDNYLNDKKLDRGNYVGSGELLRKDDNGIWGGEYGGKIQDPIPKELNKRYIDNINGKAFICIKAGDSSVVSNTIEYFTPCNVVDNLGKLQNLSREEKLLASPIQNITTNTVIPLTGPIYRYHKLVFFMRNSAAGTGGWSFIDVPNIRGQSRFILTSPDGPIVVTPGDNNTLLITKTDTTFQISDILGVSLV